MSRYIDADAAEKALCKDCAWYESQCSEDKAFWCETRWLFEEAPSIDIDDYVPRDYYEKVVEELCRKHTEEIASMPSVVRCEDCKYWLSDKPIKNKWFQNGETDQCKWRTDESPNHDDFCSYGERKE